MSDSDQTLARIDEVLGYSDDMSIEWDRSTSADAMRSRPADDLPPGKRGHDVDYIIVDEAQQWRGMLDRLTDLADLRIIRRITEGGLSSADVAIAVHGEARRSPDHFTIGFDGSRTSDTYAFVQIGVGFYQAEDGTIRRIAEGDL